MSNTASKFPDVMVYAISEFSPASLSVACTIATREETAKFSDTLTVKCFSVNSGSLSLASPTIISKCTWENMVLLLVSMAWTVSV